LSIVTEEQILEQIKRLLGENRVVLFMKGVPESPRCGFSARVVARLDDAGAEYGAVDVLVDPRIRQVLSAYSNWPTVPQLFVDGELIGGADIVEELAERGELAGVLHAPAAPNA
jgi:monothiol glutaredoxin